MVVSLLLNKRNTCYLLFSILLFIGNRTVLAQNIDFGKSYLNVTKGVGGGTVELNDELEIRASLVVKSGTYDSCRYQDVIPAGTAYIPGTIRVLTNEGKIYKQFTDGYGDDPGWITGTNVTIHLGYNTAAAPATAFRRGRVANTHKPSFFSNTCIMIASFRVRITAALGTIVSTGGGNMTYKNGTAAIQTFVFPNNRFVVYTNLGICANTIGANAIGTEFNGSFGSGKPRNRGTSTNVPPSYTYSGFVSTNMPNDYYYAIANNTSTQTGYTTLNTWAKPDNSSPTHRVFSVWDIIGDHTGAASPTAGNPAADTVANANGGYMLVINAAYRIDSAFQQVITGLCPNTYYEVSCWMRNICSKCGCDSNGRGASATSGTLPYIPTGVADSSGVAPNITFDINGIDYYTTGDLKYTGQWVRKGFTYLTGISETSIALKFFNNAPGGGGNDWALDDISVRTCSPNMKYSPSLNPNICDSNALDLYDTVRSFFNNYNYYKWQRSTDGGATWVDVTGPIGPTAPYWNGTEWEYVAQYTVPNTATYAINSGDKYRVQVATLAANLSNASCRFTDPGNVITLNVIQCGPILSTQMVSFTGKLQNNYAALSWVTAKENEQLFFEIEKSQDGFNFSNIAFINSYGDSLVNNNSYSFTDPVAVTGKVYYRLTVKNSMGGVVYSRIIILDSYNNLFTMLYAVNPFNNKVDFEILTKYGGTGDIEIIDQTGKVIRRKKVALNKGTNLVSVPDLENVLPGMYYLSVRLNSFSIKHQLIKLSN
jgi:trimeric autotransporter adhesin